MRAVPYIIYLFLISLFQVVLKDMTTVYGVTFNLAAMMVLTVALYKSELLTLWFGFFAGLVMSAGVPYAMGWHAIILAALGVVACHVRERLNMDSLWAKLLLVAIGVLIHNIALIVLSQTAGFVYLLWSDALPGTLYSAILVWVFFQFKEGHVNVANFRKIF